MECLTHQILDVGVIGQVCGQDGWILAKFFFSVLMDRDRAEVQIHTQKKNEANIHPSWLSKLGQWRIYYNYNGFRGNFSCGTWRVVPSGQNSSILPAQVANHNAGFDLAQSRSWPYSLDCSWMHARPVRKKIGKFSQTLQLTEGAVASWG